MGKAKNNPSNKIRKEKKQNQEETTMSSSIDQKSLQENRKRKFDESNDEIIQRERQFEYENLSDDEIKARLFKTITKDVYLQHKIRQWFETDQTLLRFIRQHATLLAKYYLLKMKSELYQNFIDMTKSVLPWLSEMSHPLLIGSNINNQIFKMYMHINKQLNNSKEEFSNMTGKLAKSMSDQLDVSILPVVDMKLLTSLVIMFVQEDQQRFNVELMKGRHLLMLNAKDVHLVHEFYHLQPNTRQLEAAEQIWQATIDEQRMKQTNQSDQQQKSKRIDYEQKIEIEKKLFHIHNQQQTEEKDPLSNNYLQLNTDMLMNIIESRQKILRQRLDYDLDFNKIFPLDDDHDK